MARKYVCDRCGQETSPIERIFCDSCGEEKKLGQVFSVAIDDILHVELCTTCAENLKSIFKRSE